MIDCGFCLTYINVTRESDLVQIYCNNSLRNPYIEEEQTTQWPKEKVQKDKQRSTRHTPKTKTCITTILFEHLRDF